jgi:hypothetical protein
MSYLLNKIIIEKMKILTLLLITLSLTITSNKTLKNKLQPDINPDLSETPSITNDPYLLQHQAVY